jgi:hypothetical protein
MPPALSFITIIHATRAAITMLRTPQCYQNHPAGCLDMLRAYGVRRMNARKNVQGPFLFLSLRTFTCPQLPLPLRSKCFNQESI